MICHYFFFEGRFIKQKSKTKTTKLFSTALVPCEDRDDAFSILLEELLDYGVEFIAMEEEYIFDPDEVDFSDAENDLWVEWYDEVVKTNETVFEPFYTFEE